MIFHNLRGYDSHLIPIRLEKYMSFTLNKNIFIDSMLFMNSSLDKLVKNLNDFKYLSELFSREQINLVKQKGIYPYEYMDSFKRFKEDCLPNIDCFLKDCCVTDKEYQRVCNVRKVLVLKILENIMICI